MEKERKYTTVLVAVLPLQAAAGRPYLQAVAKCEANAKRQIYYNWKRSQVAQNHTGGGVPTTSRFAIQPIDAGLLLDVALSDLG